MRLQAFSRSFSNRSRTRYELRRGGRLPGRISTASGAYRCLNAREE